MITLQQAIELASKAHEGQWRNPSTVTSYTWDKYKSQIESIDTNGNKVVWCNGNTFLVYEPYIIHPLAVMNMMDTEEEKIIAVLHDIFENTEVTLHSKNSDYCIMFKGTKYQLTNYMWCTLYALTIPWSRFKEKGHCQSYTDYIKSFTMNRTANKIKIADIIHNLSCDPSDSDKENYFKAIQVLLKSL